MAPERLRRRGTRDRPSCNGVRLFRSRLATAGGEAWRPSAARRPGAGGRSRRNLPRPFVRASAMGVAAARHRSGNQPVVARPAKPANACRRPPAVVRAFEAAPARLGSPELREGALVARRARPAKLLRTRQRSRAALSPPPAPARRSGRRIGVGPKAPFPDARRHLHAARPSHRQDVENEANQGPSKVKPRLHMAACWA